MFKPEVIEAVQIYKQSSLQVSIYQAVGMQNLSPHECKEYLVVSKIMLGSAVIITEAVLDQFK